MHPFAIWKMSNDWCRGGGNVQRRRVGRKKVTCGAGVEDGPSFDGIGIGADSFEEGGGSKGIFAGGVRTRSCKNNIGVYFNFTIIVRP
jgi:hypothetical protein